MKKIPGVKFKNKKNNHIVDSENSLFEVPYYKDDEYLADLDNFINFIKSCERMIRTTDKYKKYIRYLIEVVGLTYCQVLSNIEEESASIEMHHGPILTLFDICSIVVDHLLYLKVPINTFIVADVVLDLHYQNSVQVVMLSTTVHEQVHENNIFINLKQAFGDLERFLKEFKHGVQEEQLKKIANYIEISKRFDSNDNDILSLEKTLDKISKLK